MREIRGWNIGQVVTMAEMTLGTANVLEEIGSNGKANLPCIYNGLSLQSQSGTGGSIVTFNPGVARCQDLPTSIYTYLPSNSYGNSYSCFIDISVLDSNEVITLSTGITSGYIVATFAISPNTPGAVDYVITGSLLQIATGSYNPAIHVRLCAFTYSAPNFTLDFTPGTSRDTDLTGAGGVQWDYQNSRLVINTPESQVGSNPVRFPTGITTDSFVAPILQELTSSGTFTTPSAGGRLPLYLEVEVKGAGGGGAGGDQASSSGGGGDGTNSTFGGSLIVANGGAGGILMGGAGGGGSSTAPYWYLIQGDDGDNGSLLKNVIATQFYLPAGFGSNSQGDFGRGGAGGALIGTGPTIADLIAGGSGGSGGTVIAIIPNPLSTYAFSAGTGGIGGTGLALGSPGRNGVIRVKACFQ